MGTSYPIFDLGEVLSYEQKQFFDEHGFIHFRNFINQDAVNSIISASEEVQKQWINNNVEKINGIPIKYGKDLDGTPIVQRFAFINKFHPVLHELTQDPRFNILLELAGENSRLSINEKDGMVFNHYVNSENSKFTKMGWHTDGLRDIFLGGKLNPMLNVGIHLSNLKPENGGLRIIPGTHRQSLYQLLFRKRYFFDHEEDPNEIAILPKAGDLTIHDGRLWHRVAKSNIVGETSRRRVIYIPIISGKYEPKTESSPTAFYHRFVKLIK